ncbi:hypothetical protein GGU10DRAFT_381689 [Lentinula aff. detonsa]|uniref:Uncharacterized protein n=1 Tax=Lentinula aff. detonsa TaxID=2804958 RepID=A0AA38KCV8_9AGAR|nr:hypothetical protein GGU10DRAFT_381689 [Lentinula aff. detonsa]
MSIAALAAEYATIKEGVLFTLNTYTSVIYPALSAAGRWGECLIHATALGDSTARLQNFVPNLLADPGFYNTIFKVRTCLETLSHQAQGRNETTFIMPPCYGVVRTLTRRIHEARAASQPAAAVVTAINAANVNNAAVTAVGVIPVAATPAITVNADSAGLQAPAATAAPPVAPAAIATAAATATVPSAPATMRSRGPRRANRRGRSVRSAPVIIDSDDGDDEVQIVGGDIAMGEITHPAASTAATDVPMSVDSVLPGIMLDVAPPAGPVPAVSTVGLPADLKFKKKAASEPVIESTNLTKAQVRYQPYVEVPGLDPDSRALYKAVSYAKKGFAESRKRHRVSESGLDYISMPDHTKLAFATSTAHLNAAASSVAGPSSMEVLDRALDLVDQVTPTSSTEASLVKQEADLRAELQVTISRITYLLQFFDLLKAQHVQVLQALHVSEGPSN